jgi:hypothetical protein
MGLFPELSKAGLRIGPSRNAYSEQKKLEWRGFSVVYPCLPLFGGKVLGDQCSGINFGGRERHWVDPLPPN